MAFRNCIIEDRNNKGVGNVLEIDDKIEKLGLSENIEKFLKDNNIYTIKEIVNRTKTDFKNLGLVQNDILDIEIKVELQGFKLNGSL